MVWQLVRQCFLNIDCLLGLSTSSIIFLAKIQCCQMSKIERNFQIEAGYADTFILVVKRKQVS